MSSITSAELIARLSEFKFNPTGMHQVAIDLLDTMSQGEYELRDPSNPWIFGLEISACNAAANLTELESALRYTYASMAQTEAELYPHMSDKDYVGRFGSPSSAVMDLYFNKDELYTRVVNVAGTSSRKMVIPQHSEFKVSDLTFTMQYPIQLIVLENGALQVTYDISDTSALQPIESNVVDYEILNVLGTDYVVLHVPVNQFAITPYHDVPSSATYFNRTYPYSDQFYALRAWRYVNSAWEEIAISHTELVYDPYTPTVLLQVNSSTVNVKVPQIYIDNGLLNTNLRFDIYTTKGPVVLPLSNFSGGSFGVRWVDHNATANSIYSAPLSVFTNYTIASQTSVNGGSSSLTFAELRERTIENSFSSPRTPVTKSQLINTLTDLGYRAVISVDNVTDRIALAARSLPPPISPEGKTNIGCSSSMGLYKTTLRELEALGTAKLTGERATITPRSLWKINNGVLTGLTKQHIDGLLSANGPAVNATVSRAALLAELVSGNYRWTPFYYVVDPMERDLRCYHLDEPRIVTKSFVADNKTSDVELTATNYGIERVDDTYEILIPISITGSTDYTVDNIFVHLSWVTDSADRRWVGGAPLYSSDGVLETINGMPVWKFVIPTAWDIDIEDNFYIEDYLGVPRITQLTQEFDLVMGVTTPLVAIAPSAVDAIANSEVLPLGYRGLNHERLRIKFGTALNWIWTNLRTVSGSVTYRKHLTDVPAYYPNDIYEIDPITGGIKMTMGSDGTIKYNLLHAKGDPILDPNGDPIYINLAGDVIYEDGELVVESGRDIEYMLDILMLDGNYFFCTDANTVKYRDSIAAMIEGWVNTDIAAVRPRLLERTELKYYPAITQGPINVLTPTGSSVMIEAEQEFRVELYLSDVGYRNTDYRNKLSEIALTTIAEHVNKRSIILDTIITDIKDKVGSDLITVRITGLGGVANYPVLTVLDDSAGFNLKKRIIVLASDELAIEDDITMLFYRHAELAE